jgi:hypothetical protein
MELLWAGYRGMCGIKKGCLALGRPLLQHDTTQQHSAAQKDTLAATQKHLERGSLFPGHFLCGRLLLCTACAAYAAAGRTAVTAIAAGAPAAGVSTQLIGWRLRR